MLCLWNVVYYTAKFSFFIGRIIANHLLMLGMQFLLALLYTIYEVTDDVSSHPSEQNKDSFLCKCISGSLLRYYGVRSCECITALNSSNPYTLCFLQSHRLHTLTYTLHNYTTTLSSTLLCYVILKATMSDTDSGLFLPGSVCCPLTKP